MMQGRRNLKEQTVARRETLRLFQRVKNLQRAADRVAAVRRPLAVARREFLHGRQNIRVKVVRALHQLLFKSVVRRDAVNQTGAGEPDHFRTDGFRHALI